MRTDEQKNWHPWFRAAYEFGQRNNSFCAIKNGSPEWREWRDYFGRIGFMPSTFAELMPDAAWTAPVSRPHLLDIHLPDFPRTYSPPSEWFDRPRHRSEMTAAEMDEQFARVGLEYLRPGKYGLRAPRHGADEVRDANATLQRYAAEAARSVRDAAE